MLFKQNHLARLLLIISIMLATVFPAAYAEDWIYTVKPGDNLWNLTESYLLDLSYVKKTADFK